jgi:hypothetical protein
MRANSSHVVWPSQGGVPPPEKQLGRGRHHRRWSRQCRVERAGRAGHLVDDARFGARAEGRVRTTAARASRTTAVRSTTRRRYAHCSARKIAAVDSATSSRGRSCSTAVSCRSEESSHTYHNLCHASRPSYLSVGPKVEAPTSNSGERHTGYEKTEKKRNGKTWRHAERARMAGVSVKSY